MTAITTKFHSYFFGQLVGEDQFGNRYYTAKKAPKAGKAKRWVFYKGLPEPTKVPPEWHGWLHYTLDVPPNKRTVRHYGWEKPHFPNLTGTVNAYAPPGHINEGGKRAASLGDYQAWTPEN